MSFLQLVAADVRRRSQSNACTVRLPMDRFDDEDENDAAAGLRHSRGPSFMVAMRVEKTSPLPMNGTPLPRSLSPSDGERVSLREFTGLMLLRLEACVLLTSATTSQFQ